MPLEIIPVLSKVVSGEGTFIYPGQIYAQDLVDEKLWPKAAYADGGIEEKVQSPLISENIAEIVPWYSVLYDQHGGLLILTIMLFIFIFRKMVFMVLVTSVKLSVIVGFLYCIFLLGGIKNG